MKTRFLHTGDWQLGMTRHFLSDEAQGRFSQARFDAIKKLGKVCKDEECQFMVVCGDVFESNQVDRKTVIRALEALKHVPVPVYLLPGNHDPLNEASVFRSRAFVEHKPDHVHVIESSEPIDVGGGIEIVGPPWTSKRPTEDLVVEAIKKLEPTEKIRICVAHGAASTLAPDQDAPGVINVPKVEDAISSGNIHYLALGDRHSLTDVGSSGYIWYAGAPEPTDYDEVKPGFGLVVTLEENEISTKEVGTATWTFIERKDLNLNADEDLETLRSWLEEQPNKECTILKLRFVGTLTLSLHAKLEKMLDHYGDVYGAIERRDKDLAVIPDDADFDSLNFSGFASKSVEHLRSIVEGVSDNSMVARDALALLVRLTGKIE